MSWGHLRWSQCKNGYSFLLIQSPVWYLSLGQGWWLIVVHLMQSISRFLLSSTLSRSPWASLFNSPTLAGGHGTEVYESPRAVWARRKVAKVTEMATQSENVRNGKRGGVPERSSSMFFHVFPHLPALLLPLPMLCICVALTNQLSSPKSELSNGRQFQVKGRNGQPRHIPPSQRTPVTSWKVTFSPRCPRFTPKFLQHGNL